jgi:hypothetical protein
MVRDFYEILGVIRNADQRGQLDERTCGGTR